MARTRPAWPISPYPGHWLGGGVAPCVGILDGDGSPEIVFTYLGWNPGSSLWAWHADGTVVPGFPVPLEWDANHEMYPESLTLANLEGGPGLDILVLAHDNVTNKGHLEVYRPDGTPLPGWPPPDWLEVPWGGYGRTAVGDINGDGQPEVVMPEARMYYSGETNRVWAWRADGSVLPGFPVEMPVEPSKSCPLGPVLGDVDGDGIADIVVASPSYVHVFHGDGTLAPGWPQFGGKPVLADLFGDGHVQVIATSSGGYADPALRVYDGKGRLQWKAATQNTDYWDPAVADIDGDQQLEIVLRDHSDQVYAWHPDGTPLSSSPFPVGSNPGNGDVIESSVAIGDINGDGYTDLITGNTQNDSYLYAFPAPGPYNAYAVEWPMQGGNSRNDGCYVRHSAFGHGCAVTAAATPATVPVGATTSLSATFTDSMDHAAAGWSWSDGGVGGTFSPSASVRNPTYTVPSDLTLTSLTLSVSVTCDGPHPLTTRNSVPLGVIPKGAWLWQGGGFKYPGGVAANPADGSCWVSDYGNNSVTHLSSAGDQLWQTALPSPFSYPYGLSVNPSDSSCWVSDRYHGQAVHLSLAGQELWRGGGLDQPFSASVNAADGSCWVADHLGNCVVHLASTGEALGTPIGGFKRPASLSVDSGSGSCWVADTEDSQVVQLSSAGVVLWRGKRVLLSLLRVRKPHRRLLLGGRFRTQSSGASVLDGIGTLSEQHRV